MTADQAAIIALVAVLVGMEACGGSGRTHAQQALDGVHAPAEQDDAEAQESLGLRALAEQGHDLAQFNLGSMYLNGQGVPLARTTPRARTFGGIASRPTRDTRMPPATLGRQCSHVERPGCPAGPR